MSLGWNLVSKAWQVQDSPEDSMKSAHRMLLNFVFFLVSGCYPKNVSWLNFCDQNSQWHENLLGSENDQDDADGDCGGYDDDDDDDDDDDN